MVGGVQVGAFLKRKEAGQKVDFEHVRVNGVYGQDVLVGVFGTVHFAGRQIGAGEGVPRFGGQKLVGGRCDVPRGGQRGCRLIVHQVGLGQTKTRGVH